MSERERERIMKMIVMIVINRCQKHEKKTENN